MRRCEGAVLFGILVLYVGRDRRSTGLLRKDGGGVRRSKTGRDWEKTADHGSSRPVMLRCSADAAARALEDMLLDTFYDRM